MERPLSDPPSIDEIAPDPWPGAPAEIARAADKYRQMLCSRYYDYQHFGAPLFFGWAVYDAFLAGARWEAERGR